MAPIAAALPDGAKVLTDDVEFTSNVFPWMVHADRGVEVVAVPGDELVAAIRPGIDLVAVSAVQSSTGAVLDLAAVVAASKEIGALRGDRRQPGAGLAAVAAWTVSTR